VPDDIMQKIEALIQQEAQTSTPPTVAARMHETMVGVLPLPPLCCGCGWDDVSGASSGPSSSSQSLIE
jgi:hypothetical protein